MTMSHDSCISLLFASYEVASLFKRPTTWSSSALLDQLKVNISRMAYEGELMMSHSHRSHSTLGIRQDPHARFPGRPPCVTVYDLRVSSPVGDGKCIGITIRGEPKQSRIIPSLHL